MRKITSHVTNATNDLIEIDVFGDPGPGGAYHDYVVRIPNRAPVYIGFQNGPIAENGVNGLTQEVLLAICIDRLQCFQKGIFACRENAIALTKMEEAMHWLHHRTIERMARGVEGKTAV